jgi:hypothetical protein
MLKAVVPGMVAHVFKLSAQGRLRQEDGELQASLGYIMGPCLRKGKKKTVMMVIFIEFFFAWFITL